MNNRLKRVATAAFLLMFALPLIPRQSLADDTIESVWLHVDNGLGQG